MTAGQQKPAEQAYDLLIIGAGIFGSMLALEATQRGLQVLIVDNHDFGSGTSANSLKTIHGGLRYLQGLDIVSSLVSARERKAWLSMAPGLVQPLPCILPTNKDLLKNKWLVAAGALFYNLLTLGRNTNLPAAAHIPNAHILPLATLQQEIPALADTDITGAACWYDAQAASTERLLLAVLLAAKQLGASCFNYHSVDQLRRVAGGFRASLVDAVKSGEAEPPASANLQISARLVVDCSGRGQFLEKTYLGWETLEPASAPAYVKAINLVVKKRISNFALGIQAQDGQDEHGAGMSRALFIAPWDQAYSLIGTWYYDCGDEPSDSITAPELQSCIEQVNSAFREPLFTSDEVVQVHLGHLPADPGLLAGKGADAALLKHAQLQDWGKVHADHNGLYSLKGTKYTLARRAAEDTIKTLAKKHALQLKPSVSANRPLWSACPGAAESLQQLGWQPQQVDFALQYFAPGLLQIIGLCEHDPEMNAPVPGVDYCCQAIIQYCLRHEMVYHLSDLLVRRAPVGGAEIPTERTIDYIADLLANHFCWKPARRSAEIQALQDYYMKRSPTGDVL